MITSATSLKPNKENRADLIYSGGSSRGWGPIEHLTRLAERLLGVELKFVELQNASKPKKIWHEIRPSRNGKGPGSIYLVKSPGEIRSLAGLPDFFHFKEFRALWIVDSFWTDRAPSSRFMRHFDLVIYMQKNEASFYEHLAPNRTLYLPWGADVLDLGSKSADRPIDVLRVGRQPAVWDDDNRNGTVCAAAGLKFSGRPPLFGTSASDTSTAHQSLCEYYAKAKFVVAHSNLVSPAAYTHPEKEYLTGRWTDALAAGAVVAGIHPYGDGSSEDLLWKGATLDFNQIDLKCNVEALVRATHEWNPNMASANHLQALIRLDWRWRLRSLADELSIRTPVLDGEIERLKARISFLETEIKAF
ncbi:MAG: hypothetical protein AAF559_07650 [Pseudomonadota bacterium]